jgi:hypothetical protein
MAVLEAIFSPGAFELDETATGEHEALLVIDAGGGETRLNSERVRRGITELAKSWSQQGGLVFLSSLENLPTVAELEGLDGFLVHSLSRKEQNALTPELVTYLELYGVTQVYVCGFDTEISILVSAVALIDKGYDTTALVNLCGSGGGVRSHRAGVTALTRALGASKVVVNTAA